jgi:prevent-host-death family protein
MLTYTATEARAALPAIIDFVTEGEEITITRHGRPVAVVLSPESLRSRRVTPALKRAEELRRRLDSVPPMTELPDSGMTVEEAEARVAEIYAERGRPVD